VTFDLDAVLRESTFPPFVITFGGREHELPHVEMLTPEQAVACASGRMLDVLEDVAPDLHAALVRSPQLAVSRLMQAWLEHAGTSEGESSASSSSSRSTARPSKRTSRSSVSASATSVRAV